MASRVKQEQLKADLFPFLSVLICSIGAVVGLLFMVVYQANRNSENNKQNEMAKLLEQREIYMQGVEIKELLSGGVEDSVMRLQEEKEAREGELRYRQELLQKDPAEINEQYELKLRARQEYEQKIEDERRREAAAMLEMLNAEKTLELTGAQFDALVRLASLSESLDASEAEMQRRKEALAQMEKEAEQLTEQERESQTLIRREKSAVDVYETERDKKKMSAAEMRREIEELKRRNQSLLVSLKTEGRIAMPGVGEPVLATMTRVPFLCEAGGVWKIAENDQLIPVDLTDDLAIQIEKERLAADPNAFVQFFLKHGGERNYEKMRRAFSGLTVGFYPVDQHWDISLARADAAAPSADGRIGE